MTARTRTVAVARAGFTLMEMLVVVAILVVLAGAAVPIYLSYLEDSRVDRARLDVKSIEGAVDAYYTKYGSYPNSLNDLVQPMDGVRPYLDANTLMDPWGNPYQYNPQNVNPMTGRPQVFSNGPPGRQQPISNF